MTDRTSESMPEPTPESVDLWLKRGLEPEPEASRRIARQALDPAATTVRPRTRMRSRWGLAAVAAVAAAVLAVAVLPSVWPRGATKAPTAPVPIRITNIGDLVTAVDPAGDVWLHSPARPTHSNSPRLIITLGETNVQ